MKLQSIETLRELFDGMDDKDRNGLTFLEYQMLFRIKEGVKLSNLFVVLYSSTATIYRLKQSVMRKLNAATFEQAVVNALILGVI